MSDTDQRMFTYDNNEVDGYECPTVAAGYSPTGDNVDDSITVSCHFDNLVREMNLRNESKLLSENEAKEVWKRMILFEKQTSAHSTRVFEITKDVAKELGWDDIL